MKPLVRQEEARKSDYRIISVHLLMNCCALNYSDQVLRVFGLIIVDVTEIKII